MDGSLVTCAVKSVPDVVVQAQLVKRPRALRKRFRTLVARFSLAPAESGRKPEGKACKTPLAT